MDAERDKLYKTLRTMDANRAKLYEALILEQRDRLLAMLNQLESEEAEPQSASGGDTVRGLKEMADAASALTCSACARRGEERRVR